MKKTIFPFLLFISISLFSQSAKKGFATINKESAKKHILAFWQAMQ